jgi:hypothetical protein
MDQYSNLFVTFAEIAGVFVGFAALISVSRWTEIEAFQLGRIRTVVTIGLEVIVASLVPVVLATYGISDHTLWFVSGLVFLLLLWTVIILSLRRPENREFLAIETRARPGISAFFWILLEVPIQLSLILILLGWFPDLEPAFYTTALVFNLFQAAFVLAQLVYSQVNSSSE